MQKNEREIRKKTAAGCKLLIQLILHASFGSSVQFDVKRRRRYQLVMLDVDWIKKIQVLRFPAGAAVAALMQAGTVSYGIYGKAE